MVEAVMFGSSPSPVTGTGAPGERSRDETASSRIRRAPSLETPDVRAPYGVRSRSPLRGSPGLAAERDRDRGRAERRTNQLRRTGSTAPRADVNVGWSRA